MIERVFAVSSAVVMPFWAMMILLPRWAWTERVARSWWIVSLPAIAYAALVAPSLPRLLPVLARPTLETIAPLLGSPAGATIAWLHFLAFDLFVGRTVFLDAKRRGVAPWITSLILCAVLMVGPLGLLVYLLVRAAHRDPAESERDPSSDRSPPA